MCYDVLAESGFGSPQHWFQTSASSLLHWGLLAFWGDILSWTILDTKPTWNVTDQHLIARAAYALLENGNADAGTTFVFGQFSVQEFLDNANLIQERLLKDCAPVVLRATQATIGGQARYTLPPDWIHTRRMIWQAQTAGAKAKSLASTDSYQLDHGMLDWERNTADPSVYNEGSDLPTLTVEIAKAPSQAGTLGMLYVPQPTTLDGSGVKLTIPDEMESGVFYGAIGELLSSEGEGQDTERAEYCGQRYQLCVELANALIMGSEVEKPS